MALKSKLILLLTMAALALCIIIAGVYAAAQQKISMQGTVNIVVDDQTMYLRDVRIQHGMSQTPTSVEGFRKGYINTDFQLDLSEADLGTSSTGTFILYFDVVNLITDGQTSEYLAEASWTGSEVGGASFSIDHDSRMIDEGTVAPTAFTDSTPLSGTIVLEVNVLSGTSFDLSNITITIREPQQYTDFSFTADDAAKTAILTDGPDIENIIIPRSVSKHSNGTFWEGNDYAVTEIGERAFFLYENIKSVSIPDGVTSIGKSAFDTCTNLTTINIPDGVTSIGSSAFYDCESLTSIDLPDNMQSISASLFSQCSGLQSIVIPDGVTSIDDRAFEGCDSLTSITVKATTPPSLLGSSAIPSNVTNIYVPARSVDAYKAASGWSTHSGKISAIA